MDQQQKKLFDTEPPQWELDAAAERLAARVVFAEGARQEFDYLVPEPLREQVQPGRRVRVPFGRGNRTVVGYCVELVEGDKLTTRHRLKEIKSVVDAAALLSPTMLRLTRWMADYYLCGWGRAIEGVLPSGVRDKAGTREKTFLSVPTSVAARLTQLKLPRKQAEVLRRLAASPIALTPPQLAEAARCTLAPINALRKKGLLTAEVRRVQHGEHEIPAEPKQQHLHLNEDQQAALDAILAPLRERRHETILMHGVTGSGKTEVYIRAIEEVIGYGRQAIVLVPEISLTPQTRQRFRSRFANVAVLHSHQSASERHWHWQKIAAGEVQVVVGARSAVFAPVPRLGLIVLDEEHDSSFKQDSPPRYHARDVALWRAREEEAPLVLGSATPALESWQKSLRGEYRLVELPDRVLDLPLPDVATIDLRGEFQSRRSRGAVSRPLHQAIHAALADGGQVILLLNRRGFSTHIQCPQCGEAARCRDCEIALTHHREGEKAVCHYCDYTIPAPTRCAACGSDAIRYGGLGTQRLEAEIRSRFPEANCLRMDSDTMQKPGSHEEALSRFRDGEVQILLGTQMIAKGLDFPNVTLVGVVNADTALHFPDFRAAERTFQLVTQVAGRTGRGTKGGRVLVQTFSPDHPAILAALRHDYQMFAAEELPIREQFGYPPFSTLIRLLVRGPRAEAAEQFAEQLSQQVRDALEQLHIEGLVLGPAAAPLAKLRGNHRFHTLVRGADADGLRAAIGQAGQQLKPPPDIQWVIDVDPLDLL